MMQQLKQTLEFAIYGYDANEFMPIRDHETLLNKNEFIKYKLNCIYKKLSNR